MTTFSVSASLSVRKRKIRKDESLINNGWRSTSRGAASELTESRRRRRRRGVSGPISKPLSTQREAILRVKRTSREGFAEREGGRESETQSQENFYCRSLEEIHVIYRESKRRKRPYYICAVVPAAAAAEESLLSRKCF